CWISLAVREHQDDSGAVIEIITAANGRDDLIRRLRAEHPLGARHLEEHDDRLLDVFTEAEAFAWAAATARLGSPRFVFAEGAPDLATEQDWWVEAKSVRESDVERGELNTLWPHLERTGILMR